jgi:outer membrane protein assembly factor BamB
VPSISPRTTGSTPSPRRPARRWFAEGITSSHLNQLAVADGTVYVATVDDVAALSAATGAPRWRFAVAGWQRGGIDGPAVANGTVYLTVNDTDLGKSGRFYALDAATGAERWHVESEWPIASNPAVADGAVYVERDLDLVALDAATGAERWRYDARGVAEIAAADGVVYFRQGSRLYAVDAGTGTERWRMAVGIENEAPIVVGGAVYVAGDRHYLYAIGGTEPAGTE